MDRSMVGQVYAAILATGNGDPSVLEARDYGSAPAALICAQQLGGMLLFIIEHSRFTG